MRSCICIGRLVKLLLWGCMGACSLLTAAASPACLDSLKSRTLHYMEQEAWDSVIVVGNRWLDAAYEAEDYHGHVIDAHVALGITYAHAGDYPLAMNNLGQAHANATSVLNMEVVKRAFNEVLFIVQEEQERIMEHRKNQQLMWVGIVALTIVCLLLYRMYRQKNRLLTAIVRQNHEALEQAERRRWKNSSLTDDKKQELSERLEQLMQEQHTYCENLLTKDRVAELLATNRTYVSQVIHEAYGKSFTQYINDLRINEAIRRLDDPDNQRPLRLMCQDLGFNSPTTFNAQFQARTGMTPAQYRAKVKQLNA